jgi:hypothetical protein
MQSPFQPIAALGAIFAAAFISLVCREAAADPTWVEPPREAENAIFFELGGAALVYSVNYEHRFIPELGLRAGAGVVPLCIFDSCESFVVVPVSMYGIIGEGSHRLELGGGFTVTSLHDNDAQFAVPDIAYRYERREGGLQFRAAFTPMFRLRRLSEAFPWGGVSFGYGW